VGTATLYARNGAIEVELYARKCLEGQCQLTYLDEAKSHSIFFLSKFTCVGDEIGWDFVALVQKTKISFTGFCSEMSRRYATTNVLSVPFMSPNTFSNWFFGWLSAFKIDFRKEIDPWCGHQPKLLACDGTHIGVSMKMLRLDHPVTETDKPDEVVVPLHKRFGRVLIFDKVARYHLRYLCKRHLKKLKGREVVSDELLQDRTAHMFAILEERQEPDQLQFIKSFVDQTVGPKILDAMAKLLYLLSSDAAISSVLPFPCHDLIYEICGVMSEYAPAGELIQKLKKYSSEVPALFTAAKTTDALDMCIAFILSVVQQVRQTHQDDRPVQPASPIAGSYNPEKGVAYYFTEHGQQLRKQPKYNISGSGKHANYDDAVEEPCQKIYPKVSLGGYSYMFLWFCPVHGHTYGFHLIKSGEGRKDPFSSLFKYAETAPEEIFYDFACQLSEYCLNREPGFFLNSRFWHDLFHSITHLCGNNFKSGRVLGLDGVNTEICEQTNSYLQCVKYTASHLSQAHMMFFVQFFLFLYNKEKTKKFAKRASVALAGHL
jgi:hypothetical protein